MIYEGFSSVYDMFIDTDYDLWVDYILSLWDKCGLNPRLVLELACGTGNITTRLAKKGYDMIGVDISDSMLSIARQKADEAGADILYLSQDMKEFELYGTVDTCLCPMDGVNYILEGGELMKVFRLVHNYLNPGGAFIFDINTIYKFKHVLGDRDFCRVENDAAYIWENYYDDIKRLNEYCLSLFIDDGKGKYDRFEEIHHQKAYGVEEIIDMLHKSGFKIIGVYDGLSFDKYKDNSEKVFFLSVKA